MMSLTICYKDMIFVAAVCMWFYLSGLVIIHIKIRVETRPGHPVWPHLICRFLHWITCTDYGVHGVLKNMSTFLILKWAWLMKKLACYKRVQD